MVATLPEPTVLPPSRLEPDILPGDTLYFCGICYCLVTLLSILFIFAEVFVSKVSPPILISRYKYNYLTTLLR